MPLPVFLSWGVIWSFISVLIVPVAQMIIKALGFSVVSYVGFQIIIDQMQNYLFQHYDNLPTNLLKILDLMGVHSALGIMFSTMVGIATYKSAVAATGTVWKKPGSTPPGMPA